MSRTLIVGFDPRHRDRAPVYFGVEIGRVTRARVIVAAVEADLPPSLLGPGQGLAYSAGGVDRDLVADAGAALDAVGAELRDVHAECRRLRGTSAARALHELAEREDAALLAVGARREHRGLGGTAVALAHGAPCPVAVVPSSWTGRRRLRRIGVAYVDSEEAREATRAAHTLARVAGATLCAISVVTDAPDAKSLAERHLRDIVSALGEEVPIELEVVAGDPAAVLVEATRALDALTIGPRGYGPLRAVLLGSVSRRVMAGAHCPVIALPRGVQAPLLGLVEEEAMAVPATR